MVKLNNPRTHRLDFQIISSTFDCMCRLYSVPWGGDITSKHRDTAASQKAEEKRKRWRKEELSPVNECCTRKMMPQMVKQSFFGESSPWKEFSVQDFSDLKKSVCLSTKGRKSYVLWKVPLYIMEPYFIVLISASHADCSFLLSWSSSKVKVLWSGIQGKEPTYCRYDYR